MKKKEPLSDPWVESVLANLRTPIPETPTFEVRTSLDYGKSEKVTGYPHFHDGGVLSFTISGQTVKAFHVWYDLTRLTEVQVEDD